MQQGVTFPNFTRSFSLADVPTPPLLESVQKAPMKSKSGVGLRAFRPSDFDTVSRWRTDCPEELFLWYYKRGTASEQAFKSELSSLEQKFSSYGLITYKSDIPLGIIYAFPPEEFRASFSVGIYLAPDGRRGYIGAVAFALFARHMFLAIGAEKLRIAVAGWNKPSFDLITKTGHLKLEAVFERECIYGGKRWPLLVFAHFPEDAAAMQGHRVWSRLI